MNATAATDDRPASRKISETRITSERTDDRRNKIYDRTLTVVSQQLLLRDWQAKEQLERQASYQRGVESPLHYVREALRAELGDNLDPRVHVVRTYEHESEGFEYVLCVAVAKRFKADKPSEIPTQKECESSLGVDGLVAKISEAVRVGLAKAKDVAERAERCRIANLVLGGYTEDIEAQAKAATRYEQRLAALKAEYEAELKVQAEQLLEREGDGCSITWADAPGFEPDPRSVAAAKAKLPEHIANQRAPHERRGLLRGTSQNDVISIDEVD